MALDMQRFFFDISDGVEIHDDVGQLLPSLTDARIYAIIRGTDFVSKLDEGGKGGYIIVTIRSETAKLVTLRLVCHIEAHEASEGAQLSPALRRAKASRR